MKADKLRGIDKTELERQLQETQEQLFRFRFQMGMGQMEGIKKYRLLKKDRARMLTVLTQEHGGASSAASQVLTVKATVPGKKIDKKKTK